MERSGRRPPAVAIPDDRLTDWIFGRIIKGGYVRDISALMDGSITWDAVWRAHDMMDLQDWLDWEQHVLAEAENGSS